MAKTDQELKDFLNSIAANVKPKRKAPTTTQRNVRSRTNARIKVSREETANRIKLSQERTGHKLDLNEQQAALKRNLYAARSQYIVETARKRQELKQEDRPRELAYAAALGEVRAENAALREHATARAQRQEKIAGIPQAVAYGTGKKVLQSSVGDTLGAIIAAIAVAIILYLLLTNASGVQGTSNSILSFVTALTSTDPLFIATPTTPNGVQANEITGQAQSGNPNTVSGTNKGGA
jgi:hypothetical protein